MSKRSFGKYEGAGNDFIFIDDRIPFFPLEDRALIRRICDRKEGYGADGLILLQQDREADFRMRIFNCDGGEAESCGNGLRCLIRFLIDLGFPKKSYRIATGNRVVEAEWIDDKVLIQLGPPLHLRLNQKIEGFDVHSVDTGVPHAVIFVPNGEAIDLPTIGPRLRHHSYFQPRGANVNFASLQLDGSIRVRTFERGVEGEVLACGTGAAAVGLMGALLYQLQNPILIRFKGGDLEISWKEPHLFLVGAANQIFLVTYTL